MDIAQFFYSADRRLWEAAEGLAEGKSFLKGFRNLNFFIKTYPPTNNTRPPPPAPRPIASSLESPESLGVSGDDAPDEEGPGGGPGEGLLCDRQAVPCSLDTLPVAQFVQTVSVICAWYVPYGHFVQADGPGAASIVQPLGVSTFAGGPAILP